MIKKNGVTSEAPISTPQKNIFLPALSWLKTGVAVNDKDHQIDDAPDPELLRLAKIYLNYLRKEKFYLYQQERLGFIISALSIYSDNGKINLKSLTSEEDVHHQLRLVFGLQSIYEWLQTKENAKKIVEESGKEKLFQSLWKFNYNKEFASYFSSVEEFPKKIQDLQAWLKIVSFLITSSSLKNRRQLTFVSNNLVLWKKRAVYSLLLVTMTLNLEKVELSLAEIEKFLRIVDDYKFWRDRLQEKIANFESNSGITELFASDEMRNILDNLEYINNRTIFNFIDDSFPLKSAERRKLQDLKKMLDSAVTHVVANPSSKDRNTQLEEVRREFTKIIKALNTKHANDFLIKKPNLMFWLSKEKLTEILIWNYHPDGNLLPVAKRFELLTPEMEKLITTPKTLGETLQSIFGNSENPEFGIRRWFLDNERLRNQRYSPGWEDKLEKDCFLTISSGLSTGALRQLLNILEEEGSGGLFIPIYICLALYLENKDSQLPQYVLKSLKDTLVYFESPSIYGLFLREIEKKQEKLKKDLEEGALIVSK